jgi:hypothetical protein
MRAASSSIDSPRMMRADFNRCENVVSILLVSQFYRLTNIEINI